MSLNVEKYRKILELEVGKLPRKDSKITQDYRDLDLQYLGISHTFLRKLKIEEIYLLSIEEQFEIYTYCFHTSQIFEVLSYVLMQLDSFELDFLFQKKEDLLKLSYDIEHWNHSDLLSKIYANLVEKKRAMLTYLSEFALNGSMWQRRLSLTSLIYYSAQRSNPLQFDIVAQKIKILLDDEEYYVQKAIGWTLRELYNVCPNETTEFLEIYIKDISSIAFQAATEKLSEDKKEEFKVLRKNTVSNPDEFEKKPAFERL
jgi:3-methyladenine DNA glycosylase AlkD